MLAPILPQPIAQHRNDFAELSRTSPRQDNAMLIAYYLNDDYASWPLSQTSPSVIGRHKSCDVILGMRKISRRHARVQWFQGSYVIEDLGSINGTTVNGVICQHPMVLFDGDEIQLGDCTTLYYLDEEKTEPIMCLRTQFGVQLDHDNYTLIVNGSRLNRLLSPPQFALIKLLFDASGEIVSRDTIADTVWPDDSYDGISEQAIDALVRRIRLRIHEIDTEHEYIETVRGFGFRFVQKLPNRWNHIKVERSDSAA